MTALAIAVHWVHVLAGISWFGGQIFLYAALWPAVLELPPGDARAFIGRVAPRVARIMAALGPTIVITGLLRGIAFGPLQSRADWTTPYGLTFVASLAIVLWLSAHGNRMRGKLGPAVFGEGAFPDRARAFLARQRAITLGALGTVLLGMVLMRFGL